MEEKIEIEFKQSKGPPLIRGHKTNTLKQTAKVNFPMSLHVI